MQRFSQIAPRVCTLVLFIVLRVDVTCMHIENELLMHCTQSVRTTMKTNITFLDCFALFGAHQHDVIMQIYA